MSFDDFIYLGQSNKVFIWREMGSNYGNNYGIVAGLWKYMMWEESILNKDKEGKGQKIIKIKSCLAKKQHACEKR